MVIALNAGSNPNGQVSSIGVHGDGKDAENSFFGNFGDLLTLISADAENALHENNPEAKLTAKQTNEALLALVEGGSDDAKLAISSILKRVTFEDSNQLNLPVKEDIQTSSFLEAKIESKLEQQNLLKPLKELEFFSLADLESFVKGLEQSNVKVFTENPLNKNSVLIETPLAGIAADMDKEHYASAAGAVVTTSNLVSNAAVATSPDIVGTTAVSRISEPFSLAVGINDPISVANYPVDEKGQIIPVDEKGQIIPVDEKGQIIPGGEKDQIIPGGEKDQIILDVVKDILQVNSATLTISKKGPSEVIFDLRDLKEVILQKFPSSSRSEKEVKLPLELVIPYTLPIKIENNLAENSLTELDANEFNKVEVTKITLDRNLIELQVPDEINVIENTNKDQKSFTVKGGELLLNPSPELQRKLVIGIAIPKGSSVNELPDFVKIQVSMDNIKTLTDPMTPKPNTTKEYLTSNLIEMPRGLLQDNNLGHLVKNMQVLLTALGEQNNELVDDINIVSINKFSKPSQQTVQNLVSKGPVEAETLSNSFINRPLSAPVTMLEKSTVPEYSEPKAQFNGQDRLASILSIGLTAASDTKKHNVTSRAATSVLALGARVNFFMSNNKNSLDPEAKENINSFSTKPSSIGNTYSENVFEMFNNKNATPKFLDPAEAKNLFQSQNNIAIPAQASEKFINSSLMAGERVLSSNNMPLTPALVENKISLYEAQYASRLGMAVVEKVKTGQENFDIHLTPESFGKIKVNVNLDFRAIDVKIFTETLGAAAIFKDHENTLQQIMEQNGMKLASFTVGSQSSNDQQRQFANQNKDKPIGKTNGRGNKVMTTSNQSESSTSGQSGLNLIA